MSQNTQARTVATANRSGLDIRSLVLLAILLAAVIGLISAAVIQLTTTSPFIDFAAEGISAVVMALVVRAGMRGAAAKVTPLLGTVFNAILVQALYLPIKKALKIEE